MNKYIGMGLSFVGGLLIGGLVTKKIVEKKFKEEYEVIEEEPVEKTEKELIAESDADLIRDDEKVEKEDRVVIDDVESDAYQNALESLQYKIQEQADGTTFIRCEGRGTNEPYYDTDDRSKPYLIAEEQYEDVDGYDSDEYTLFRDGYICNSLGEVMTDREEIIRLFGEGFEDYFDELKTDKIIIRNEPINMDFDIIRDVDNLKDIASPRIAHQMGWDVE